MTGPAYSEIKRIGMLISCVFLASFNLVIRFFPEIFHEVKDLIYILFGIDYDRFIVPFLLLSVAFVILAYHLPDDAE